MSLWEESRAQFDAVSSFPQALSDPGTDPGEGPFICIRFNQAWQQVVLGCLLQACQPPAFGMKVSADSTHLMQRATKLLNMFASAGVCPMSDQGVVTLTIPAGYASTIGAVSFASAFPTPPHVDVSCNNPDILASWSEVTEADFSVTITAAVPVRVDTTADVSWTAEQS
jgi:hypothetical protein